MDTESFFIFAVVFAASIAALGVAAATSRSPLRFMAPLAVVLAAFIAYEGIDTFLGSAKPVDLVPGWHRPVIDADGATVVSATFDANKNVYILLQETEGVAPKLYLFPGSPEFGSALKKAMEGHAKTHNGDKFGFKMKDAKALGENGRDGHMGLGQGGESVEDREVPYKFEEPQPPAMPAKD